MTNKDFVFTQLKGEPSNIKFHLRGVGIAFSGYFRIHFYSDKRRNQLFLTASKVYFEGLRHEPNESSPTLPIESCVDTLLYVERKMQWILEAFTGGFKTENVITLPK